MKFFKDQRGFGLIEGLLVVIALTLVAGVSYYVYSSQKKSGQPSAIEQSASQPAPEQKQEDSFFEFKELGVKIELTPELEDLKYSLGGYSQNTPYYFVTSEGLEEQIIRCVKQGGLLADIDKSFGSIAKSNGTFEADIEPVTLLKQFDTFYVTMGSPQASPCDDPLSGQAENVAKNVTKLQKSFQEAFKTAEEIQ